MGRLHETYSRDLVIERVGDDTHADTKEKAVYVVNPTGSPDSALVADLHLVHQVRVVPAESRRPQVFAGLVFRNRRP